MVHGGARSVNSSTASSSLALLGRLRGLDPIVLLRSIFLALFLTTPLNYLHVMPHFSIVSLHSLLT